MIPLATIGYESAPQARVIDTLKAAGVEVLIENAGVPIFCDRGNPDAVPARRDR